MTHQCSNESLFVWTAMSYSQLQNLYYYAALSWAVVPARLLLVGTMYIGYVLCMGESIITTLSHLFINCNLKSPLR
jgi:hypothetical protein